MYVWPRFHSSLFDLIALGQLVLHVEILFKAPFYEGTPIICFAPKRVYYINNVLRTTIWLELHVLKCKLHPRCSQNLEIRAALTKWMLMLMTYAKAFIVSLLRLFLCVATCLCKQQQSQVFLLFQSLCQYTLCGNLMYKVVVMITWKVHNFRL